MWSDGYYYLITFHYILVQNPIPRPKVVSMGFESVFWSRPIDSRVASSEWYQRKLSSVVRQLDVKLFWKKSVSAIWDQRLHEWQRASWFDHAHMTSFTVLVCCNWSLYLQYHLFSWTHDNNDCVWGRVCFHYLPSCPITWKVVPGNLPIVFWPLKKDEEVGI